MAPAAPTPRFAVRFDERLFDEDLRHVSPSGRLVARKASERYEREGLGAAELTQCDPVHRDGTRLPNCVKTYLPEPGGRWRMVFEMVLEGGTPVLAYLAFGAGHPEGAWQLSAYEVAHHRLHSGD